MTLAAKSQQLVADKDRKINILERRLADVEEQTKLVDELRRENGQFALLINL
jgi:hypothetical protein